MVQGFDSLILHHNAFRIEALFYTIEIYEILLYAIHPVVKVHWVILQTFILS